MVLQISASGIAALGKQGSKFAEICQDLPFSATPRIKGGAKFGGW